MTEQQQREACAELARRMGWTVKVEGGKFNAAKKPSWYSPEGKYSPLGLPDPFTDAAASRELMLWLAKQECTVHDQDHECYGDGLCLPFGRFIALVSDSWAVDRFCFSGHRFEVSLSGLSALLTLEPSVIARAACKALGIEVSE